MAHLEAISGADAEIAGIGSVDSVAGICAIPAIFAAPNEHECAQITVSCSHKWTGAHGRSSRRDRVPSVGGLANKLDVATNAALARPSSIAFCRTASRSYPSRRSARTLQAEPEQRSVELSDFAEFHEALDLVLISCKGGDEASQDFIGMEL
jgi:hypothetical protein